MKSVVTVEVKSIAGFELFPENQWEVPSMHNFGESVESDYEAMEEEWEEEEWEEVEENYKKAPWRSHQRDGDLCGLSLDEDCLGVGYLMLEAEIEPMPGDKLGGFPAWVITREFELCSLCHSEMIVFMQFDVSCINRLYDNASVRNGFIQMCPNHPNQVAFSSSVFEYSSYNL